MAKERKPPRAVEPVKPDSRDRQKAGLGSYRITSDGTEEADDRDEDRGPPVPITSLNSQHFSPLAWGLIERARALKTGGKRADAISTRRLATAVLYTGDEHKDETTTASWLRKRCPLSDDQLMRRMRRLYPEVITLEHARRGHARMMTPTLARVLRVAQVLATHSASDGIAGARHIVAAILAEAVVNPRNNAARFLNGCRIDALGALSSLGHDLAEWRTGDDLSVWARFLTTPGSTIWQGDGEPSRVATARPGSLPSYAADSTHGPDLLGITREVEAMAALVSAWSVEPPLSIGLFGEWGSGKTFFLRKMQERVRQITQAARESMESQRDFGFYKNIVQVEFNAWHYVEGNLWASVVEHIFQNLRVFDQDPDAEVDARRARLMDEMNIKLGDREKLEREKEQLEAAAATARADAEDARRRANLTQAERAQVESKTVAEAVQGAVVSLRPNVRRALAAIGVQEGHLDSLNELRNAIDTGRGSIVQIRAIGRAWWGSAGKWRVFALAFGGPVIAVSGAALLGWFLKHDVAKWMAASSGAGAVLGLVSAGAEGIRRLRAPMAQIDGAFRALQDARNQLDAAVSNAEEQKRQKVVELEQKAADLRRQAELKEQEAQTAKHVIERIGQEIESLQPGSMIASFIQERAGAEDYRKHLGLPAVIRRDFEKLARMFAAQRRIEQERKDGLDQTGEPIQSLNDSSVEKRNDRKVLNRIILYVDDLDRCPPDRVVEVLRVIHLLLAFPLFVVVVAVDARWMRRSLRNQFPVMLGDDDAPERSGASNADSLGPEATADDYLEKIFQVPFWIRPLDSDGCRGLVQGLVASDRVSSSNPSSARLESDWASEPEAAQDESRQTTSDDSEEAIPSNAPAMVGTHGAETQPPNGPWTPVERNPPALQISSDECDYMVRLSPLIGRSPRAVKRFVNCYRLIKSMDGTVWLGGFRPTMLLLAVTTGLPEISVEILSSLRASECTTASDWLRELSAEPAIANNEVGHPLVELVTELAAEVDELAPLRAAVAKVEQFSFRPMRRMNDLRAGLARDGGQARPK